MFKINFFAVTSHGRGLRFCAALAVLCCAALTVRAQSSPPPLLIAQANSTRAVALDSVTLQREPFSSAARLPWWSSDNHTRIIVFATNLDGATVANLTAEAEDENRRSHTLRVEYVGPVAAMAPQNVSQVVLRIGDDLDNLGDVLLKLTYRGVASNRVRIGMGFVGGGPPDDVLRITGRVTGANNAALGGVILSLSGTASGLTATDAAGNYSFPNLVAGGSYTVSAAKTNYTFTPPTATIARLVVNSQADFIASLVSYKIGGQLAENGRPMAGVRVVMSGGQSATTTTDAAGNYSFSAVAEGNYLITPESPFFAFTPSSAAVVALSGDRTQNFSATPSQQTYSISGFVKQPGGSPLAGALVTLAGERSFGAVTDASGFYAIANVTGGANYTMTVVKEHYELSPPSLSFPGLDQNKVADFTAALKNYTLAGRVTDGGGAAVPGVVVTLSGSRSATATTDAGGDYSFTVPAGGSYVLTPSSQLNSFAPANRSFANLSGDQTTNFGAVDLDGFHVLQFDGTAQSVDYGEFFHPRAGETELGKFYWEFWAMPGDNAYARYMLSDGFGGAHALLFGFNGDTDGKRYTLYGNVWNGTTQIDFGSDDGPAPGEWGHCAVGWDGANIYTYFNGVPVGVKPFAGPRLPGGANNGAGRLYIGGSDHSNFMGHIEQVRGFEYANPRDNGVQTIPFQPETLFDLNYGLNGARPSFLTNFLRPGRTVNDLAGGLVGVVRAGFPANGVESTAPLPRFVIDPNAPNSAGATFPPTPTGKIDTPQPAPDKAIIFDSFSRKSATYAFNGSGGLGSTESGTAGVREWKTAGTGGTPGVGRSPFGLINGKVVSLANTVYPSIAWVETSPSKGNLLTSVSRLPGFYKSGLDTGIAFRVRDASNYFFAFTFGDVTSANARKLIVGYYLNALPTFLVTNVPMPQAWTRLQVATRTTGGIDVFADGVLIHSLSSDVLTDATGTGLFHFTDYYALANRWDNFTVHDNDAP